jgi:hypothetical protein
MSFRQFQGDADIPTNPAPPVTKIFIKLSEYKAAHLLNYASIKGLWESPLVSTQIRKESFLRLIKTIETLEAT